MLISHIPSPAPEIKFLKIVEIVELEYHTRTHFFLLTLPTFYIPGNDSNVASSNMMSKNLQEALSYIVV